MFESNHRRLWLGGTVLIEAMLGLLIVLPWLPMVSSDKKIQLEFLKSEPSHALLFFGFSGCGEICPIAMERLNVIKPKGGFPMPIQVGLVNIAPELPAFVVSEYAKAFDPEFEGLHFSQEDLSAFSEELGLSLPSANAVIPTSFFLSRCLVPAGTCATGFLGIEADYLCNPLDQAATTERPMKLSRSEQKRIGKFESCVLSKPRAIVSKLFLPIRMFKYLLIDQSNWDLALHHS